MNWTELKYWVEKNLGTPPFEDDFPVVGKHGFPQLAQTNFLPEKPIRSINYLKSTEDRKNYWFHCFTDDKNFHRIYNVFKDYLELLKQTKGLISADFSLFRDYDEQVLIDNCRANRMIDYAVQQAGIPMIPTAGFAGESSWEWCFDGLPKNSTVAITTNTVRDLEAKRLFVGGVNTMIKKFSLPLLSFAENAPIGFKKDFPIFKLLKFRITVNSGTQEKRIKVKVENNGRIRRIKRKAQKTKRRLLL